MLYSLREQKKASKLHYHMERHNRVDFQRRTVKMAIKSSSVRTGGQVDLLDVHLEPVGRGRT